MYDSVMIRTRSSPFREGGRWWQTAGRAPEWPPAHRPSARATIRRPDTSFGAFTGRASGPALIRPSRPPRTRLVRKSGPRPVRQLPHTLLCAAWQTPGAGVVSRHVTRTFADTDQWPMWAHVFAQSWTFARVMRCQPPDCFRTGNKCRGAQPLFPGVSRRRAMARGIIGRRRPKAHDPRHRRHRCHRRTARPDVRLVRGPCLRCAAPAPPRPDMAANRGAQITLNDHSATIISGRNLDLARFPTIVQRRTSFPRRVRKRRAHGA